MQMAASKPDCAFMSSGLIGPDRKIMHPQDLHDSHVQEACTSNLAEHLLLQHNEARRAHCSICGYAVQSGRERFRALQRDAVPTRSEH